MTNLRKDELPYPRYTGEIRAEASDGVIWYNALVYRQDGPGISPNLHWKQNYREQTHAISSTQQKVNAATQTVLTADRAKQQAARTPVVHIEYNPSLTL